MKENRESVRALVVLHDSLNHEVTRYTTKIFKDALDNYELDETHGCYIRECQVDDELGFRCVYAPYTGETVIRDDDY